MAIVCVCNRCGKRLDGNLDRQAGRHIVTLEISSLGGHPARIELDLCNEHADEVLAEFTQEPFMDQIEGRITVPPAIR